MRSREAVIQLVHTCSAELREYAGTDACNALLRLLDSMAEAYMHELIDVPLEYVPAKQVAARQIMALRELLTNEHFEDPRI